MRHDRRSGQLRPLRQRNAPLGVGLHPARRLFLRGLEARRTQDSRHLMGRPERLLAFALASLAAAFLVAGPEKKGPPHQRDQASTAPPPFTRAFLLDGRPFPEVAPFAVKLPEPKRTLYVSDSGPSWGGSKAHPWTDLQVALRELRPGDRLIVPRGYSPGPFSIDATCQDGTPEAPIQAIFDKGVLKAPAEGPRLTVGRAFWIL